MRNLIVWEFISPPKDNQKETKLKYHLVKGKCFTKKEKKNYWIVILCFLQIQVYIYILNEVLSCFYLTLGLE